VIVLVIPAASPTCSTTRTAGPLEQHREIVPRPELLGRVLGALSGKTLIALKDIALHFGGVKGDRRARSRDQGRRGARPDRPQRQRQDRRR
jgi:hypothetical protein